MSSLRKIIQKLILETVDPHVEKLNFMMDTANDDADPQESWNQINELIEALYGDNPPPDLKVWGAMEVYEGEILGSGMTQEEAMNYRHDEYVPCTEDMKMTDMPQLYPGTTYYMFVYYEDAVK